jgi:hypothetical protein
VRVGRTAINYQAPLSTKSEWMAEPSVRRHDKLLQEAKSFAKMLRRALHRANPRAIADSTDLAAVKAWIDNFKSCCFGRSRAEVQGLGC